MAATQIQSIVQMLPTVASERQHLIRRASVCGLRLSFTKLSFTKWLLAVGWVATVSTAPAIPAAAASQDIAVRLATVADSQIDRSDREQAAAELLQDGQALSLDGLVALMSPQGDPSAHGVIARVLVAHPMTPPDVFTQPLFELLTTSEAPLVTDVARALARYSDSRMVRPLADIALDTRAPPSARRGATLALRTHRTPKAVEVLLQLTEPDELPVVREAAFSGLTRLSGMRSLGTDRAAWMAWWHRWRKLSPQQRLAELVRGFEQANVALAVQLDAAFDRLLQVQRELYRATAAEQKPEMLVNLLKEPMTPLRLLGIELTVLRRIDNLVITTELEDALLARLDDPSPVVREQVVTKLLRVLANETAAGRIARRLQEQSEDNPDVLRAYLLMMARLPRPSAVAATIQHLRNPALSSDAAGALAAMNREGLLEPIQADLVRSEVRQQLHQRREPTPQMIMLLGQIAVEEDWALITGWLDHPHAEVKLAAARAVADSKRSLTQFRSHLHDPLILPIYIQAASQRGDDERTLMTLIGNKPDQPGQVESWQRALIAVAKRISPVSIILADLKLDRMNEPTSLRGQVLSVAIEPLLLGNSAKSNPEPLLTELEIAALVKLLILRAHVRMEDLGSADPRAALDDYQRVADLGGRTTPAQQRRIGLGMVRAQLVLGDVEKALATSRQLLGTEQGGQAQTELADQLIDLIMAAAQRGVESSDPQRKQRAKQMVGQLPSIFAGLISQAQLDRLAILRAHRAPVVDPKVPRDASAKTPPPPEPPPPESPESPSETPASESASQSAKAPDARATSTREEN